MGGKVVSERQTGRREALISMENFVAEASTNGNSIQNLVNPCFLLCSIDCSTAEGEVSLHNEVVATSEYEKLPAANILWGHLALHLGRYEVHWLFRWSKRTAL